MSRLARYRKSVLSGYGVLTMNVAYSLASVPLALHYLDTEEFGLWALAMQLASYLQLIDLGMSGAVSRILIDHKDDPTGGDYGDLLKTGFVVLSVQALVVAAGGCGLAFALAGHLSLPEPLVATFRAVFCWLSLGAALGFATKLASHILTAHQRHDLINYSQLALFAVSFAALWLGFHWRLGVYSLVLASLAGILVAAAFTTWACCHLRLFPTRGGWGRFRAARFWELFSFGKDLFLIAVGTQLIMASQTILVTKVLGLHAAAVWSVCTRVFNMLYLFVWRPFDTSCPALSEMLVRGEAGQLQHRFRSLVVVTLSLTAAAGVGFAALNQSFVNVWTHGRIQWPVGNDVLLAALMLLGSLVHCLCTLPGITKQIGAMRYVYLLEGVSLVALGYFMVSAWAYTGLILTSIVCALLYSAAYGLYRTQAYFRLSWADLLTRWPAPALRVLAITAPLALAVWHATQPLAPWPRLLTGLLVLGPVCAVVFARFGLERELRLELVAHLPHSLRGPGRSLLGAT